MYTGKLNLQALPEAEYVQIKGRNCLVIPVDATPAIFVGQKGIYLNISCSETKDSRFGYSHIVFANIQDRELRDKMTESEKRAKAPILGNLTQVVSSATASPSAPRSIDVADISSHDDDLPLG